MPVWVSPPPKTPVAAPSPTGGRTAEGKKQSRVSTAPMAVVASQGHPCRPGCAHPPPEPRIHVDVPVHEHVSLQYNQRLRRRKVAPAWFLADSMMTLKGVSPHKPTLLLWQSVVPV